MNLLTDSWIPVQEDSQIRLISLQQILCTDEQYEVALARDDIELACLQLLVCLTQVLFLPEDKNRWIARIRKPLSGEEYQQGIADYFDWFDLQHKETPFMQVRGVQAKEITPIQKLLVGLPEGNNHAFFNDAGEVSAISESAAAILLFNQAMNAPSFGGGFKGGFRGGAPITTLMKGSHLRMSIWFNVLYQESVERLYGHDEKSNQPVWVDLIKAKSSVSATGIGLLRGLLWQPAHIELAFAEEGECDFYGIPVEGPRVTGFKKEKFVYDVQGDWPHPHSPSVLDLKTKIRKYRSFTTTAPAWTQLNHFLVETESKKEGFIPAEVVRQFRTIADSNQLIVGGYRNKQASILQRRHDLFPLRSDWDKNDQQLTHLVNTAQEIKRQLRNKLYRFAENTGAEGVFKQAEFTFYHRSELFIQQALREIDWSESAAFIQFFKQQLMDLSWEIFAQVTKPYAHEPKMLKALAVSKLALRKAFKEIRGEAL